MTAWFFAVACGALPLGVLIGVCAPDSKYIGAIVLAGMAAGIALTKVLS